MVDRRLRAWFLRLSADAEVLRDFFWSVSLRNARALEMQMLKM